MLNDGLIVPSPVFSKQTSFFKYVNKGPPLSCTFRIKASGYLIKKHGESNCLCKTDTRKPNFPLSNCWKPLVPDVLHLAISSSVKKTSTEALQLRYARYRPQC